MEVGCTKVECRNSFPAMRIVSLASIITVVLGLTFLVEDPALLINLRSDSPLSVEEMTLPHVDWEWVKIHNTEDRVLVVVGSWVLDVSDFRYEHPGGNVFDPGADDLTRMYFNEHGCDDYIVSRLKSLAVGSINRQESDHASEGTEVTNEQADGAEEDDPEGPSAEETDPEDVYSEEDASCIDEMSSSSSILSFDKLMVAGAIFTCAFILFRRDQQ
ncbi:hypothetical protein CYMTET_51786 [Cymbomonas tetramitiformis]|uniref:Cytochrome b5 heme-binding domain-containing protein n=1 Tax=Cymbomonas tetramitiformis TaxID=36881 RepID=A0AAE0BLI6_9CHLO|nr:hypothetical protein CYMTET_51786 [Cymbomonas tetramitiformis]